MKKIAIFSFAAVVALGLSVRADEPTKVKGEAACAKCELHTADTCQATITITGADGKKEVLYAEQNPVAKAFHKTICHGPATVEAEGTVSEKDGKKVITLTKIAEAK